MTQKVAICFHEKLTKYDLGEGNPFRGDRFENAMKFLREQGLLDLSHIDVIKPHPTTREDLLRVHDATYIDFVFNLAEQYRPYDVETPVSPDILEGALLISGAAIECGRIVIEGIAGQAISLGGGHHHAGRGYGGGFCLFNDVAIVIEYLRAKHGLDRFLIIDHDVHFGNGTSDIYYRDPTVLYISLHQDPRTIYPGTGFTWQTGEGKGDGYNVNVPLPPGTDDDAYLYALNEIFVPLAEEFKPQIIISNGGSDPHYADSLGSLALTANGFFEIARTVRRTAESVCNGQLIALIGSGYNPTVLPVCWYALAAGIAGLDEISLKEPYESRKPRRDCRKTVESTVDELRRILRKRWACFGGFAISGIQ